MHEPRKVRPIAPADFVSFPAEETSRAVQVRFRSIAAQHPDKTAFCTRNESWTYQRLDIFSTNVAEANFLIQRINSQIVCNRSAQFGIVVISGIRGSRSSHHRAPPPRVRLGWI